jgi:hypothetical protein
MTAPKAKVMQMEYQNQSAEKPLILPVLVMSNTPDEEIRHNIRVNSAKDLEWIKRHEAHGGVAVLVGGGGSIDDCVDEIKRIKNATVFAMNGASKWCNDNYIDVDYQFILDAKKETGTLVDQHANQHIFGSQVNPMTMDAVEGPIVWHCNTDCDMEREFPQHRIDAGGYALLSGGSAVGNSSMSVVYALGFREFHVFGFDSCHKEGKSHAYDQPMNRFMPVVPVTWGGKEFTTSVAMKSHAEDFQITSQMLKRLGCEFTVYGEGLLQAMYNTEAKDLSEQEKYQTMWSYDLYRKICPGEHIVDTFLEHVKPDNIIMDFGCGTGRTSLSLFDKGHDVMLLDFTDNCRDQEAVMLPFIQWDLTRPIPAQVEYGICTDVMEHIPPDDVLTVLKNIIDCAEEVFFQISTVDDACGEAVLGEPLHLSVHNHLWWEFKIEKFADVVWSESHDIQSLFHVKRIT